MAETSGDRPQRPDRTDRNALVVKLLEELGDRLKRSETDREQMKGTLAEWKRVIAEMESRTERNEQTCVTLEGRIGNRERLGEEVRDLKERAEKLESLQHDQADAIENTRNAQAQLETELVLRVINTESQVQAVTARIDEAIAQNDRIMQRFEKFTQERMRLLRRVERMEEDITSAHEALRAKAMVLLTDQGTAARMAAALPGATAQPLSAVSAAAANDLVLDSRIEALETHANWWQRPVRTHTAALAAMVAGGLVFGGLASLAFRPDVPQIAVLEGGGLARLDLDKNRWEPIAATKAETPAETETEAAADAAASEETAAETTEAKDLNAIEPAAAPADSDTNADAAPAAQGKDESLDEAMDALQKGWNKSPPSDRVTPDDKLPASIRGTEKKAFQGDIESQHDLAAIYTAGHGGVARNYDRAAQWFLEAAQQGNANAGYNLGVLYHQGLGVPKDVTQAIRWYKMAAQKGHPDALYNLGVAYMDGIGVPHDPQKAAGYFEKAANAGIADAAYTLGMINENGLLGEPRIEDALRWYKKAANDGNVEARTALDQLAAKLGKPVADAATDDKTQ